jgi:hypothetical protein
VLQRQKPAEEHRRVETGFVLLQWYRINRASGVLIALPNMQTPSE